jgi:asparagine synthase (glutamine-hydrolysing)
VCWLKPNAIDRMTFIDTASYLVDDILAKVDRASMSASLEVRCPLLDYRVIEMSWRFPATVKTQGGVGKQPLRNILYRHVPRALGDRPKMGFGAPVDVWLTNELRDWAEALMSREALARHGLLNVEACRTLWEDFTQRGCGWNRVIWNILMFQAWHQAMRALEAGRRELVAA